MSAQPTQQSTTQDFLDIFDITNDVVIMKDGAAALILTVSAMNFGLLAEEEQDAVIYTYAALLNSLNYTAQIVIQSQTKDVTSYLQKLKDQEDRASSQLKREFIGRYRQFVSQLITERNVLDKKFYVTIPASTLEMGFLPPSTVVPGKKGPDISTFEKTELIDRAKSILEPRRDHLVSQFARIGLFARQLTTQEIIQVFYNNYNPEAAEGQQITDTSNYTTPLVQAQTTGGYMQTPTAAPAATQDMSVATAPQIQSTPDVMQSTIPPVASGVAPEPMTQSMTQPTTAPTPAAIPDPAIREEITPLHTPTLATSTAPSFPQTTANPTNLAPASMMSATMMPTTMSPSVATPTITPAAAAATPAAAIPPASTNITSLPNQASTASSTPTPVFSAPPAPVITPSASPDGGMFTSPMPTTQSPALSQTTYAQKPGTLPTPNATVTDQQPMSGTTSPSASSTPPAAETPVESSGPDIVQVIPGTSDIPKYEVVSAELTDKNESTNATTEQTQPMTEQMQQDETAGSTPVPVIPPTQTPAAMQPIPEL